MENKDYPALFQHGDTIAVLMQKRHFLLVRVKIAVFVAIAVVTSVTWVQVSNLRTVGDITLAILIVGSISFTAIMNSKKFDRGWLSNRMIAESAKTEAWLFMMNTDPYDKAKTEAKAETLFLSRLNDILRKFPLASPHLAKGLQNGTQITDQMKNVRKESFEARREFYLKNRVQEQRLWYIEKAEWNGKQENLWSAITWSLEFIAAALAIINIRLDEMVVSPVGIVTAVGAAVLSWVNAKSYAEPAELYGVVSENLALYEERISRAENEKELSYLTGEVEDAINREHAVWMSRL
jgi:hypothetical protein